MFYIVLSLYILSVLWMLMMSLKRPNSRNRFIAKCVTSSLFVILAICAKYQFSIPTDQFFVCMFLALIGSLIGDVFLGLSNVKQLASHRFLFVLGFAFFFVAQCLYVYSFTFASKVPFSIFHVIIPILGILVTLKILISLKVKDMLRFVLCIVYTIMMAGMLSATTVYAFYYDFSILATKVFFAGLIFAISDYTLLFKYFYVGKRRRIFVAITTVTYYVAQLLMILTLIK